MWRKQDEPKPSPSVPDLAMPPSVSPASPELPPRESRPATGNVTEAVSIKGELTGRDDLYYILTEKCRGASASPTAT